MLITDDRQRNSGLKPVSGKRIVLLSVLLLIVLLTMAYIFHNSMEGMITSNAKSEVVSEKVQEIAGVEGKVDDYTFGQIIRKWAHFIEFFVLGAELATLTTVFCRKVFSAWLFAPLFAALATGVVDEYIQSFTSRTSSVSDVLIDFGGAVCGIAAALIVRLIIQTVVHHYQKKKQGVLPCQN